MNTGINRELLLEAFIIFLLERLHVLSDVSTEDVLLEDFSVEFLGFDIESRETFLGVGDEDTTIGSTLHGTEDTGTGGSALETDIKVSLEGAGRILLVQSLSHGERAIGLGDTLVLVSQTELRQSTASDKQAGGVSCEFLSGLTTTAKAYARTSSPVGQAVVDAVSRELLRGRSRENEVTLQTRVDDLHDDLLVGEADDQAVFWCVAERIEMDQNLLEIDTHYLFFA